LRLAVIRGTDPKDYLDAIAFLTWPALVAPVIAPVLGGVITDTMGWRWIFFLNVPLGIIAVFVGLAVLPKDTKVPTGRFDVVGFLGVAIIMVALTVGADLVGADVEPRGFVTSRVGGIAVVVSAFVVRWLCRPGRIIVLRVLRVPTFRVGNSSGSIYRLVITAVPFMFAL